MRLYHGSKDIIRFPQYGFGKKYNDYGQGFYCTQDINMAYEWAVDFDRSGYANEYKLTTQDLHTLDLTSGEYSILNWLAILLDNRVFEIQSDFGYEFKKYLIDVFMPDYYNYDLIVGYRADDSYFSFAQDFINNLISLSTLNNAMYLGDLGLQYVLKSEKAFERIKYVSAHIADANEWYPQKEKRDRTARMQYSTLRKNPWRRGEIYAMNIIDQEMRDGDVRLRL